MSEAVTIESVNQVVQAANGSYAKLANQLTVLDKNVLNDLRHLYDHQETIADQIAMISVKIDALTDHVNALPIKPSSGKGKSLLFWGGIALVGYAVYKSTEPKGKKNG